MFHKKGLDLFKMYELKTDKLSLMGLCISFNFAKGISTLVAENRALLEGICAELGAQFHQDSHLNGFSPLGFAVEKKNLTLAKLLISKGAKINKSFGVSEAASDVGFGDLGFVSSVASSSGVSPLGYAIEIGDYEMCELLLLKGAHLEHKFAVKLTRETPLEFAVSIYRFGIAELLISKGAKTGGISSVDLSHESVSSVPRFLPLLKNLKHAKFNQKILETVPQSIRKRGEKEILSYFRDLLADVQIQWNSAKVMVLGKEGVGKTHLSRRMRGKSYGKNISTDGIDVAAIKFRGMELSWFDFGGQEVYYPTHSFFLTAQCLYLVVFNLDDPEFKRRVTYWLRTVASFTQDPTRASKILVVGTHADSVDQTRIDFVWTELSDLFNQNGSIIGYVAVSCSDGTGFDVLELGIEKAIELGNLAKMFVPKAYKRIEAWVLEVRKAEPKLAFDHVLTLFPSLKERTVRQALEFLHDMGVCLFFESLNLVITDPQWLATMFSSLITFSHNWVKDGIVVQSDLGHIWRDSSDTEIMQIMHLLKKFEVAFPKKQEGLWVIPSMLRATRESEALNLSSPKYASRFQRLYRTDVLPLGLFGRLIARLQEWDILIVESWLNGVVIETETQMAEVCVLFDQGLQSISISCVAKASKPPNERFLIQRLAEECNSLFEAAYPSRNGLERPIKQYVVCRHCLDNNLAVPTCLSFEQCVAMIVSNTKDFLCHNYKVPVAMIGDDVTFGYVEVFEPSQCSVVAKPFTSGGFGDIFMCSLKVNTGANVIDAVAKELKTDNLTQGFAEFQHETSIMSRLVHPNIVKLFGIMLNPLRMILEFCSEGDLFIAINRNLIKTEALKLKIGVDIARGMEFLHLQTPPLAHRDLRSPNILLFSLNPDASVCAKVSDFGLTVSVTETISDPLNSWQWMAPEAQMGDDYTETCDLYSYAVVLWEVFSGLFPFKEFESMKQMQLFRALREEGLRPTIPKDTPNYVQSLLRRMWSSDPFKRPSFTQAVETFENKKIAKASIALDTQFGARPKMGTRIAKELFPEEKLDAPLCMAVAGEQVWVGFRGGNVVAFDAMKKEVIRREVRVHTGHVLCISKVPRENRVWSGGRDSRILCWKVEPLEEAAWSSTPGDGALSGRQTMRKNSPPTVVASKNKGEITAMASVNGHMIVGDSAGTIVLYDASGLHLATHKMEMGSKQAVSAIVGGVRFDNVAWFGGGLDLFKVTTTTTASTTTANANAGGSMLQVERVVSQAHERFVGSLIFCGKEIWSAQGGGNSVKVWNAETGALRYALPLPKAMVRVHHMSLGNLCGEPVVWMGCDDMVMVYSVKRCVPLQIIPTLQDGDVLCTVQTGLNCIWTGTRHKEDRGTFTECTL